MGAGLRRRPVERVQARRRPVHPDEDHIVTRHPSLRARTEPAVRSFQCPPDGAAAHPSSSRNDAIRWRILDEDESQADDVRRPQRLGADRGGPERHRPPRRPRDERQLPADLVQQPVGLAVVAPDAGRDDVGPLVPPAARARVHVVDGVRAAAAVRAPVVVALQHRAARGGHRAAHGDVDVAGQAQDDRQGHGHVLGVQHAAVGLEHGRLAGHHEHHGTPQAHDAQRLHAGVEQQGACSGRDQPW